MEKITAKKVQIKKEVTQRDALSALLFTVSLAVIKKGEKAKT